MLKLKTLLSKYYVLLWTLRQKVLCDKCDNREHDLKYITQNETGFSPLKEQLRHWKTAEILGGKLKKL